MLAVEFIDLIENDDERVETVKISILLQEY